MKTIKDWQREIHQLAREKGWYDSKQRTPLEIHMLIVSEIAEATEAVRNNELEIYVKDDGKWEGEAVELADALIRILDYAESRGWDMDQIVNNKHEYNKTRAYRHGGKKL